MLLAEIVSTCFRLLLQTAARPFRKGGTLAVGGCSFDFPLLRLLFFGKVEDDCFGAVVELCKVEVEIGVQVVLAIVSVVSKV